MAKKNDDPNTTVTPENTKDMEGTEGGAPGVISSEPAEAAGKRKKMSKEIDYENGTVTITLVGGNEGSMTFHFSELPDDVKAKFGPFGLGHKLGDAAAGTSGAEAESAIKKVWEGLVKGDWTVRAPAAPKLDKKNVMERLANMDPEKQEAAKALLASLGFTI